MSGNATRLTLYAMISAVERDLRAFVSSELMSQVRLETLISEDMIKKLKGRISADFQAYPLEMKVEHGFEDLDLIDYLDFKEAFEIISANKKLLTQEGINFINSIAEHSEHVTPIRNRVMHTRPLMVDDFSVVYDFCKGAVQNWASKFAFLAKCFREIESDAGFVLRLEIPPWQRQDTISHNLPMPDFDETGFIGRQIDVNNIKKLLLGPYPVINIVGVGGVGKTALAVKVAYDLLDDPDCPFEAIVYSTSKTTTLGTHEIKQIENAITDSVGVFRSINKQLGAGDSEDFNEIIEYMKAFKILLVIDNLETVLDYRIKEFLQGLPLGSKVLITSRIGVGAYDNPYALTSLDKNESLRLLKSFAKSRAVQMLINLKAVDAERYLLQMKYIPAFIKWFVLAVSTGKRPEEILAKPKLVLEFCMQNVYSHLPDAAKKVLEAMLSYKGFCTYSVLHYLTELSFEELDAALIHLATSNMIIQANKERTTIFRITELPLLYLENYCRPSNKTVEEYRKKARKITADGEDIDKAYLANPYDPSNVHVPDSNLRVVAKYLNIALKAYRSNPTQALENIAKAKRVEPGYSEVHRIEAQILADMGDPQGARDAYELAIESNPKSAPLRFWMAVFLLRSFDDHSGALEQLKEAKKLDARTLEIDVETAWAYLVAGNFPEAEAILKILDVLPKDGSKTSKIVSSLHLQLYKRRADSYCSQRLYKECLSDLNTLLNYFKNMPLWHNDSKSKELMLSAKYILGKAVRGMYTSQQVPPAQQSLIDSFEMIQQIASRDVGVVGDAATGFVVSIEVAKGFGFLRSDTGTNYFFHFTHCIDQADFYSLVPNKSRVKFTIGANDRGMCAYDVGLIKA